MLNGYESADESEKQIIQPRKKLYRKTKTQKQKQSFSPGIGLKQSSTSSLCTVGSKILLHPNTTTNVSLSHPFGVYDNLRLVGNKLKSLAISRISPHRIKQITSSAKKN